MEKCLEHESYLPGRGREGVRKLNAKLKIKVPEPTTLHTLTYGAQNWTLTKAQTKRLENTRQEMERRICGL